MCPKCLMLDTPLNVTTLWIFIALNRYHNLNTVVGIVDDVKYYRKLKPTITSHM